MEIRYLKIGNRTYSYSLVFIGVHELVLTFYEDVQESSSVSLKILEYDAATGFIAYAINNSVIKGVVQQTHQDFTVFLQGALTPLHSKKVNALQSNKEMIFNVELGNKLQALDLLSPLSGRVVEVFVKNGDFIKIATPLLVIESMKMENVIYASRDAYIKNVFISSGDLVKQKQKLVSFKQAGELYGASQTTNDF